MSVSTNRHLQLNPLQHSFPGRVSCGCTSNLSHLRPRITRPFNLRQVLQCSATPSCHTHLTLAQAICCAWALTSFQRFTQGGKRFNDVRSNPPLALLFSSMKRPNLGTKASWPSMNCSNLCCSSCVRSSGRIPHCAAPSRQANSRWREIALNIPLTNCASFLWPPHNARTTSLRALA